MTGQKQGEWDSSEIAVLRKFAHEGKTAWAVAQELRRDFVEVLRKAEEKQISIYSGYVTAFPYDPNAPGWNEGEPWSEQQEIDLKAEAAARYGLREIAVSLQRSEKEVAQKAREIGIKIKGA